MRKEDNREKYKEYDHRYYIKHKRPNSKIGKLETKISDLEAKLADKEKENDKLTAKLEQANEIINNPDTLIFQQQELIDNLQSQLAEKDVEIKKINACVEFYKSYYISFKEKVIDELEKVKEILIQNADEIGEEYKEDYFMISLCNVKNIIDNQINQLTHQHEDKGE